jgi:hypothetical protein
VFLAGVLILAAFIIAPSLQAPPPHATAGVPGVAVAPDASRQQFDAGGASITPAAPGKLDQVTSGRPSAVPEGQLAPSKAVPSHGGAQQVVRNGEREPNPAETGKPAKRRRAAHPARAPQDDASAADLSVRWNQ